MQPVPDGSLSATSLLTVLANDVQPIIRYDIGDRLRYYPDPCPCGSPFRSFQVEGRQATLLHVGDVTLSPLVFDLEHEQARRIQLVQSAETEFELRIELGEGGASEAVLERVIQSVKRVFQENHLPDVEVRPSQSSPQLTGKLHRPQLRRLLGDSGHLIRLQFTRPPGKSGMTGFGEFRTADRRIYV